MVKAGNDGAVFPLGLWLSTAGFAALAVVSFQRGPTAELVFDPRLWGMAAAIVAVVGISATLTFPRASSFRLYAACVIGFAAARGADFAMSVGWNTATPIWLIVVGMTVSWYRAALRRSP